MANGTTPAKAIQQSTAVAQRAASVAGLSFTPGARVTSSGQVVATGAAPAQGGGNRVAGSTVVPSGFSPAEFLALPPADQARIRANLAGQTPDEAPGLTMDSRDFLRAFVERFQTPSQPPSLTGTFQEQRELLGLDALEQRLATLQTKRDRITTSALVEGERAAEPRGEFGRPALRTIRGRRQRIGLEASREAAFLDVEIAGVARQVQAKNQALATFISLSQQDFQNANTLWNQRFTQALALHSSIKEEEREDVKQANATLDVVAQTYRDAGFSWEDLPENVKATIETLELQADRPFGLTEIAFSIEPEKETLTTVVSKDKTQASIIYKDGSTETVSTGLSPEVEGVDPSDLSENILKVRSSVRQEPQFKLFNDILNAYQNVQVGVSQDNAAGDLAIVNGIARMLDPGGVVRPAEFTTVEEAQGWFERFTNTPFKVAKGRIATKDAIERFDKLADDLITEKAVPIKETLETSYGPISLGLGVELSEAVPEIKQLNRLIGEAGQETLFNIGGVQVSAGDIVENDKGQRARVNEDGSLTPL